MSYTTDYLSETSQILDKLDVETIDKMVSLLVALRERGGRLFEQLLDRRPRRIAGKTGGRLGQAQNTNYGEEATLHKQTLLIPA